MSLHEDDMSIFIAGFALPASTIFTCILLKKPDQRAARSEAELSLRFGHVALTHVPSEARLNLPIGVAQVAGHMSSKLDDESTTIVLSSYTLQAGNSSCHVLLHCVCHSSPAILDSEMYAVPIPPHIVFASPVITFVGPILCVPWWLSIQHALIQESLFPERSRDLVSKQGHLRKCRWLTESAWSPMLLTVEIPSAGPAVHPTHAHTHVVLISLPIPTKMSVILRRVENPLDLESALSEQELLGISIYN